MLNQDSVLKSRDITLLTKVCIVRAMVFLVVMYRCESWTIKKAERWRIDAFELWCWRRLLRVPWTSWCLDHWSGKVHVHGQLLGWGRMTKEGLFWICWFRLKVGQMSGAWLERRSPSWVWKKNIYQAWTGWQLDPYKLNIWWAFVPFNSVSLYNLITFVWSSVFF